MGKGFEVRAAHLHPGWLPQTYQVFLLRKPMVISRNYELFNYLFFWMILKKWDISSGKLLKQTKYCVSECLMTKQKLTIRQVASTSCYTSLHTTPVDHLLPITWHPIWFWSIITVWRKRVNLFSIICLMMTITNFLRVNRRKKWSQ